MSGEPTPKHFLRGCLLLLIAEQPDHGYELVERLEGFGFDGSDAGGVYRTLRAMDRGGMVRSTWRPSGVGPFRRVYELTELGRAELVDAAGEIYACHERLGGFLDRWGAREPPRLSQHPA